jgi:hypothetical protein
MEIGNHPRSSAQFVMLWITLLALGSSGCQIGGFGSEAARPVLNPPSLPILATDNVVQLATGTPDAAALRPTRVLKELGPTETYRNEDVGFSIEYPQGWSLLDVEPSIRQESYSYAATFQSWSEHYSLGTEGIPEGGTKFDLVVTRSGAKDLAEAVVILRLEYERADPQVKILGTESLELGGGLPVERWEIESAYGGRSTIFFTAINGVTILVAGIGDPELIEAIAHTLRKI